MNLKTSDLLTSETVILKVWPCLQLVGTTSTQKQRFVPFFTQIHLAIHQQFFDTPALLSTEGWDNFPHFLLNYLSFRVSPKNSHVGLHCVSCLRNRIYPQMIEINWHRTPLPHFSCPHLIMLPKSLLQCIYRYINDYSFFLNPNKSSNINKDFL